MVNNAFYFDENRSNGVVFADMEIIFLSLSGLAGITTAIGYILYKRKKKKSHKHFFEGKEKKSEDLPIKEEEIEKEPVLLVVPDYDVIKEEKEDGGKEKGDRFYVPRIKGEKIPFHLPYSLEDFGKDVFSSPSLYMIKNAENYAKSGDYDNAMFIYEKVLDKVSSSL
jgi:hypothetical protein